jgi:hypothetical protein
MTLPVAVLGLDEKDRPLARSEPVINTVTDGKVKWKAGSDSNALTKDNISLKFVIENAKLYSFAW